MKESTLKALIELYNGSSLMVFNPKDSDRAPCVSMVRETPVAYNPKAFAKASYANVSVAYQTLTDILYRDAPVKDIDEVFDSIRKAVELLKRALDKWGDVY